MFGERAYNNRYQSESIEPRLNISPRMGGDVPITKEESVAPRSRNVNCSFWMIKRTRRRNFFSFFFLCVGVIDANILDAS